MRLRDTKIEPCVVLLYIRSIEFSLRFWLPVVVRLSGLQQDRDQVGSRMDRV